MAPDVLFLIPFQCFPLRLCSRELMLKEVGSPELVVGGGAHTLLCVNIYTLSSMSSFFVHNYDMTSLEYGVWCIVQVLEMESQRHSLVMNAVCAPKEDNNWLTWGHKWLTWE